LCVAGAGTSRFALRDAPARLNPTPLRRPAALLSITCDRRRRCPRSRLSSSIRGSRPRQRSSDARSRNPSIRLGQALWRWQTVNQGVSTFGHRSAPSAQCGASQSGTRRRSTADGPAGLFVDRKELARSSAERLVRSSRRRGSRLPSWSSRNPHGKIASRTSAPHCGSTPRTSRVSSRRCTPRWRGGTNAPAASAQSRRGPPAGVTALRTRITGDSSTSGWMAAAIAGAAATVTRHASCARSTGQSARCRPRPRASAHRHRRESEALRRASLRTIRAPLQPDGARSVRPKRQPRRSFRDAASTRRPPRRPTPARPRTSGRRCRHRCFARSSGALPLRRRGRRPASVQCRFAFAHNSRCCCRFVSRRAVVAISVNGDAIAHGCTCVRWRASDEMLDPWTMADKDQRVC